MADPSNEPASSSGVSEQVAATTAAAAHATPIREDLDKSENFPEPDKKRRKTTNGRPESDAAKTEQKLEHRLGGILCCAVCLDLPRAAVYQVSRPPPPSVLRRDQRVPPMMTTTTSTWTSSSSSSFFLEKILFSSFEARRSEDNCDVYPLPSPLPLPSPSTISSIDRTSPDWESRSVFSDSVTHNSVLFVRTSFEFSMDSKYCLSRRRSSKARDA